MDSKNIMALLNNIVTNKDKVGENEQVELSFMDPDNGQKYTAEEMAELIPQMDIDKLSNSEIEMLETLHRKLANDDANGNLFSNEDVLVGPLEQKINEYNHVVQDEDFNSNLTAIENLKTKNQNLSMVNIVSLKEYETDSKSNLDYVTVKRENGKTEMLPITDSDYMDRFVSEHANDISGMDGEQFYNTLKNSTETEIEFVDMNMFNANPEIKNKMNAPRVHDEQILGFEQDEVRRLVEQFIPGTPIEIGIDKSGEIFYRAGDALFKGVDEDGRRQVRFVQNPEKIDNYIDNKAINDPGQTVNEEVKVDSASLVKGGGDAKRNMFFDVQRLNNLMMAKDTIVNGDDKDLKNEFFGLISGGLKDRNQDTINKRGQKLITDYYNSRINDYELMKNTGNTSNGVPMSSEEIHIMEEIQKINNEIDMDQARSDYEEDKKEEISEDNYSSFDEGDNTQMNQEDEDIFGFDDDNNQSLESSNVDENEDFFEFDNDEPVKDDNLESTQRLEINDLNNEENLIQNVEVPRITNENVKSLAKRRTKNNTHHGLSAITLIIEIVTVALIVMMFLSLDI